MPSTTAKMMAQSDSSSVAGKSVRNSCSTGRLVDDRGAEIAVQDAAEIVEILHDERPVEAELLHELGVALGRHAALAGHQHAPDRRAAGG